MKALCQLNRSHVLVQNRGWDSDLLHLLHWSFISLYILRVTIRWKIVKVNKIGCMCWSVVTLMTSDVWSDMYVYWNRECTCWSVVTLMTSDVWSMSQDVSQLTPVFICSAAAYRSFLSLFSKHPVYVYLLTEIENVHVCQ